MFILLHALLILALLFIWCQVICLRFMSSVNFKMHFSLNLTFFLFLYCTIGWIIPWYWSVGLNWEAWIWMMHTSSPTVPEMVLPLDTYMSHGPEELVQTHSRDTSILPTGIFISCISAMYIWWNTLGDLGWFTFNTSYFLSKLRLPVRGVGIETFFTGDIQVKLSKELGQSLLRISSGFFHKRVTTKTLLEKRVHSMYIDRPVPKTWKMGSYRRLDAAAIPEAKYIVRILSPFQLARALFTISFVLIDLILVIVSFSYLLLENFYPALFFLVWKSLTTLLPIFFLHEVNIPAMWDVVQTIIPLNAYLPKVHFRIHDIDASWIHFFDPTSCSFMVSTMWDSTRFGSINWHEIANFELGAATTSLRLPETGLVTASVNFNDWIPAFLEIKYFELGVLFSVFLFTSILSLCHGQFFFCPWILHPDIQFELCHYDMTHAPFFILIVVYFFGNISTWSLLAKHSTCFKITNRVVMGGCAGVLHNLRLEVYGFSGPVHFYLSNVFSAIVGIFFHLFFRNTAVINIFGMDNHFLSPRRTRTIPRVRNHQTRQPRPLGLGHL